MLDWSLVSWLAGYRLEFLWSAQTVKVCSVPINQYFQSSKATYITVYLTGVLKKKERRLMRLMNLLQKCVNHPGHKSFLDAGVVFSFFICSLLNVKTWKMIQMKHWIHSFQLSNTTCSQALCAALYWHVIGAQLGCHQNGWKQNVSDSHVVDILLIKANRWDLMV